MNEERLSSRGHSRFLGRFALVNTGTACGKIVVIKYAKDSTVEDPIMTLQDSDEMVHINNIDPSNATQLEMRMYCAHLDATGRGNGGTFGTYPALSTARLSFLLEQNVNLEDTVPTENQLKTVKYNWEQMTKKYLGYIHPSDRQQYNRLKMVYDEMLNKIKKNKEKLNNNTYCE